MTLHTIAFLNNKGGVGKTTLVYHLAWMFAELGYRVVAADLDPQANLTSMFLDDDIVEEMWNENKKPRTIAGCLLPLQEGVGDVGTPHVERVAKNLGLVVGDLKLATVEDELSSQWSDCLSGKPRAFRVITAFWRLLEKAAQRSEGRHGEPTLVLIDVGPSLGALNRAALISATDVVIPLMPDLYSLQGLDNLVPTLNDWRKEWKKRLEVVQDEKIDIDISLPSGAMKLLGYVALQHQVRLSQPVQAYERWLNRIPEAYRKNLTKDTSTPTGSSTRSASPCPATPNEDTYCLAQLKHYRSLMPLAQDSRKPIFHLTYADGALGGHFKAAKDCGQDFRALAQAIAEGCSLPWPAGTP